MEKTIPMPVVQGRIDHLSIDTKRERLFVAALGNNTLEVIDLKAGKLVHSITGLSEPQGVLYVPALDRLYVANASDGTLRIFDASSFKLLKSVPYGDDADNVRYDSTQDTVYVGYGSGALGALNKKGEKIAETKLGAHPESFQLEKNGPRIFVNLPKSREIAVVDRKSRGVIATWNTGGPLANYPMALDEEHHRLFIVCRSPARLIILDTDTGKIIQSISTVGDCDDVFYDQAKSRIYAIGGEGAISVIQQQTPDRYDELARIKTIKGARTGFFSPELGRLYVATRRAGTEPAAIQVYKAEP
ncbi:MAG: hypothetical protein M3Z14_06460 [Candidatus Eremiobacteraeota bacterium]|nr:hypothetical protein [Candidatus Eremiobacteraeota bacterium]